MLAILDTLDICAVVAIVVDDIDIDEVWDELM